MLQRLEHPTCCHLTLFFFTFKKEILLQHTADNEVSALARLNFFDKLLIGRETRVRLSALTGLQIERVNLEKIGEGFTQGQGKLSVITSVIRPVLNRHR